MSLSDVKFSFTLINEATSSVKVLFLDSNVFNRIDISLSKQKII